jgi:peptidoglycan-binding protein ArfA
VPQGEVQRVAGKDLAGQIQQYLQSNPTAPKRFTAEGATFEVGSAELTSQGKAVAGDVARVLADHPQAKVRIEGYADATGSPVVNKDLSQNRADAVQRYLSEHGVSADRITTAGLGSERPVAPNDTAAARLMNRRIELVVTPR